MARYRRREVFEAVQWNAPGDHPAVDKPVWSHEGGHLCKECGLPIDYHGTVHTFGIRHKVCPGDWIVNLNDGEWHRVKREKFEAEFEKV